MNILETLTQRAISIKGRVVLPEAFDSRTLKAANSLLKNKICDVVLLGDKQTIYADAQALKLDISQAEIINPPDYKELDEFIDFFYNKRKDKGITAEQARHTMQDPLYFGSMLVKTGVVNGMVAGAANTTSDVLRAALQVVGVKPGLKTVSSAFIMVVPNFNDHDTVFLFSDCAVVPVPTAEQLADIAMSAAETCKSILGDEPRVALLSFSTKGSAKHELVEKVQLTREILVQREVSFAFDGELQLDAAIVPQVAASKAPGSEVAGKANVLIFPDLQSGNIGYKLVQRLARAEAIGPIIQGLAAPVCDLSRGCSWEDIANTAVLVLLMSQAI